MLDTYVHTTYASIATGFMYVPTYIRISVKPMQYSGTRKERLGMHIWDLTTQ